MVRPVFRVDHDNERPPWRNGNEIGVRHGVTLTTGSVNFVRHEWNTAIESADGLYDHEDFIRGPQNFSRLRKPLRRAIFVERGDAFARFVRFARLHVIFQRKIDIVFY